MRLFGSAEEAVCAGNDLLKDTDELQIDINPNSPKAARVHQFSDIKDLR